MDVRLEIGIYSQKHFLGTKIRVLMDFGGYKYILVPEAI